MCVSALHMPSTNLLDVRGFYFPSIYFAAYLILMLACIECEVNAFYLN